MKLNKAFMYALCEHLEGWVNEIEFEEFEPAINKYTYKRFAYVEQRNNVRYFLTEHFLPNIARLVLE